MRSPHWRDETDNAGTEPAPMQEATGFYSRAWAGERRPTENGWDFKKLVYVPGCAWRGKAVVTQKSRSVPTSGQSSEGEWK